MLSMALLSHNALYQGLMLKIQSVGNNTPTIFHACRYKRTENYAIAMSYNVRPYVASCGCVHCVRAQHEMSSLCVWTDVCSHHYWLAIDDLGRTPDSVLVADQLTAFRHLDPPFEMCQEFPAGRRHLQRHEPQTFGATREAGCGYLGGSSSAQ